MTSGIAQAVDSSRFAALPEDERKARESEHGEVKKSWDEYDEARKFDKDARSRYAVDRRYAAGTADASWAVNSNLIGSYIDILVSFLYARDPDVSVKKAPQVDPRGSRDLEDFASTLQIVISSLWKSVQTRLKTNVRKQVRSSLSVGPGWVKALMICNGTNIPQTQSKLGDIRDNIANLEAQKQKLLLADTSEGETMSPEELDAEIAKARDLEASLQQQVEVALRKKLVVDFVNAADVQVALNVPSISDYMDADWVANAIYRTKDQVKALFPKLSKNEDLQGAKTYYLKPIKGGQNLPENIASADLFGAVVPSEDAEQYTSSSTGSGTSGETGPCFYKIVEKWDKRTNHVYTMIDGVKCWAKEPYQPDYPSTRFYPYFGLEFYLVDGARHPQSLSWRLQKLQDEYARSRSNFRLTRERSIPGVIFNKTQVSPESMKALEKSVHQEFVGIDMTDPSGNINAAFAPKPVAGIDMRLYDNAPIISDMEKIAGVQEALQASVSVAKTAREAEIQQSGFASRTNADRDTLEVMLTDLAQYTAEQALTALTMKDVQRIAGASAFWPEGMALEDLLTLVEVQIEAGTTGKPKESGDREAWGVVLPVIKETIMQVQQAFLMGNEPLAKALTEVLRETMKRMGDDTDIERFIPSDPMTIGAGGGQGAAPGGAPPAPGADGGAPPEQPPGPVGAPGDLPPLGPLTQPV